jgi:predicted outer membrane repeat protein
VLQSTLSENTAGSHGGAVYFAANGATGSGGGIANFNAKMTVAQSTIAGNTAADTGGGIYAPQPLTAIQSIVANNPQGGNCGGGQVVDQRGALRPQGPACDLGSVEAPTATRQRS